MSVPSSSAESKRQAAEVRTCAQTATDGRDREVVTVAPQDNANCQSIQSPLRTSGWESGWTGHSGQTAGSPRRSTLRPPTPTSGRPVRRFDLRRAGRGGNRPRHPNRRAPGASPTAGRPRRHHPEVPTVRHPAVPRGIGEVVNNWCECVLKLRMRAPHHDAATENGKVGGRLPDGVPVRERSLK